ncbi:MAG TPA: competence/damage-inducible protein A [Nitrospirae bacterium]|nr:nicotinamide-nucleotide amidohydrolase PncC [bacterium BMS3Abin06]HDH12509.1 competence/damage-inducible protein A [Nitrospirota bacterium]HDZ00668.1 competence/damage-inducible protein A [Nitrospirota bacterium]
MKSTKTAGIIIIGNEILSGKVQDINSFYLACELRKLGVDVKRISVIPDEIDIIGREAVEFSEKYDYVFTSGGVGPTHDDVTMAGIAKGFGLNLIKNDAIKNILYSRYKDLINSAVLKMTEVPEGSEIDFREEMRFPVVSFKNIFIFPGIPEYLKNKFSIIKEKFRSPAFYLKRIYLNCHESNIAEILNAVVKEYEDVTFGSYPVLGKPGFRVIVTAEAKSEEPLTTALDELISRLPDDLIVRVE